ncbi:hypothetical protein Agub_g14439 [Astrephomene gubernaculifera]|uniref:Uncharacterized protein n=1 Tax=Astrephomene gubernaculifera TaxID=47775 RepID=A0AAD3E1L1_9CHLO|nr:hypothetical protein Agub_g14439 [Astrephomene gubernaculifera]
MDINLAYKIMRYRAPGVGPTSSANASEPSSPALAPAGTTNSAEPAHENCRPQQRSPSPPRQRNSQPPVSTVPQQQQQQQQQQQVPPHGAQSQILQRAQGRANRAYSAVALAGDDGHFAGLLDLGGSNALDPPNSPTLHIVPRPLVPSARGVTIGPFAEALAAAAARPVRRRMDGGMRTWPTGRGSPQPNTSPSAALLLLGCSSTSPHTPGGGIVSSNSTTSIGSPPLARRTTYHSQALLPTMPATQKRRPAAAGCSPQHGSAGGAMVGGASSSPPHYMATGSYPTYGGSYGGVTTPTAASPSRTATSLGEQQQQPQQQQHHTSGTGGAAAAAAAASVGPSSGFYLAGASPGRRFSGVAAVPEPPGTAAAAAAAAAGSAAAYGGGRGRSSSAGERLARMRAMEAQAAAQEAHERAEGDRQRTVRVNVGGMDARAWVSVGGAAGSSNSSNIGSCGANRRASRTGPPSPQQRPCEGEWGGPPKSPGAETASATATTPAAATSHKQQPAGSNTSAAGGRESAPMLPSLPMHSPLQGDGLITVALRSPHCSAHHSHPRYLGGGTDAAPYQHSGPGPGPGPGAGHGAAGGGEVEVGRVATAGAGNGGGAVSEADSEATELAELEQWAASTLLDPAVVEATMEQRRTLKRIAYLRSRMLARGGTAAAAPASNTAGNGPGSSGLQSLPSWATELQSGRGGSEAALASMASQVSRLPHIDYDQMRDPQYRMMLKARSMRGREVSLSSGDTLRDIFIQDRHKGWKPPHV